MKEDINLLKVAMEEMRKENRELQALVMRHEHQLKDPELSVITETEFDPEAHPKAVKDGRLAVERNLMFRVPTLSEHNSTLSPSKQPTQPPSPSPPPLQPGPSRQPPSPPSAQPGPSRQPPPPSPPPLQPGQIDLPIKSATTMALINRNIFRSKDFKREFVRMINLNSNNWY